MKYLFFVVILGACMAKKPTHPSNVSTSNPTVMSAVDTLIPAVFDEKGKMVAFVLSDEDWKQQLTPDAYRVLRHEGTERAFTGKYYDHHEHGIYVCAGCKLPLYGSEAKFESGTGWPSFTQPIALANIKQNSDMSYGMTRVEVECARCGGHLGHMFTDGPKPTGKRHCINSVSLGFVPSRG